MDRDSLLSTLSLLKKGRLKLVSSFISHDVELFGDMFRFERSPVLMGLAINRFNVSWISHHYELFDQLAESQSSETEAAFKECVLALIERLDTSHDRAPSAEWALVKALIYEKKALLEAQFDFSNKDDLNYKKLVFSKHREAALFERIFAQAMGK
jgi:hypothetical protein